MNRKKYQKQLETKKRKQMNKVQKEKFRVAFVLKKIIQALKHKKIKWIQTKKDALFNLKALQKLLPKKLTWKCQCDICLDEDLVFTNQADNLEICDECFFTPIFNKYNKPKKTKK